MARRTPRITDTGTHLKVELTQGQSALVDYVDRDLVDGVLWNVRRKHYRERTVYYVVRKAPQPNPTGKKCLLHREVGLRLWPDLRSDEYPDHKNKDPLDNRRANLRRATMAQNNQNQRARAGCDSVYKGVTRSKDDPEKWVATIICRLGQFDSEEEAARAYDRAARVLHGDFANLNFPPLPRRPRP